MEWKYEKNRIFAENEEGKVVAEVTFPMQDDGVVNIDHTFVDASLRGQGVAGKLMDEAVKAIESQGIKAVATCSYAVSWFEQHPECGGVLK